MSEVYFATTNPGKIISVTKELGELGIDVKHVEMEIPEYRHDDVEEVAKEKTLYAYKRLKKPTISIDAGFFIPSLKGFPMTYVNPVLKTISLEGILKLVHGKDRTCYFHSALAYMDETLEEPIVFTRDVHGTIAETIIGNDNPNQWSELWKIFIPQGETKTLSEFTKEEFDTFQARIEDGSYYRKLASYLTERFS